MKQFTTPHCHVQSFDSASTPEDFAKREIEIASGAITCTDHGWMGAVPKVYELAKKHKLVPILGVEAYFRDDDCPILAKHGIVKADNPAYIEAVKSGDAAKLAKIKPSVAHYGKYFHTCIHCKTEAAYHRLVKEMSWSFTNRAEKHGSETKPLFNWEQMERICGPGDVTITSGCLIGVVQHHVFRNGRPDIARAYYERMRSLVKPGDFYVEAFPHRCTHYWTQGVQVTLVGATKPVLYREEKLLAFEVNGKRVEMKANQMAAVFKKMEGEKKLIAHSHHRKWYDIDPAVITEMRSVEEFTMNDCTPDHPDGDVQKLSNQFVLDLAREYGDKVLISDDAHFAKAEQKLVQDAKLTSSGGSWKFHNSYHRQTSEEAWQYFKNVLNIDEKTFESWIDNSHEFRDKFKDFKFEPKIHLPSNRYPEDTIGHLKSLIDKHGRMNWGDSTMVERLKTEVTLLKDNGTLDLLPYFFLAEEAIDVYRQKGSLVGVGRGSSGGVLINYLLGITHMNPLDWGLSLERFITLDRIQSGKLPDIDMDFPERDTLMDPEKGWLKTAFGDRAAAISTRTGLRLKSSIKDVFRAKLGNVPQYIEALCRKIPNPPQGINDEAWVFGYTSDDGKEVKGFLEESEDFQQFVKLHPEEWSTIRNMLGIMRGMSRHASAWILSDVPVSDFIPTCFISGYLTTQYEMVGVEAQGGLKMDFLGLQTIGEIGEALSIIRQRQGVDIKEPVQLGKRRVWPHEVLPHDGKLHWIWDLPEDQDVFRAICEGRTETVFQLNTNAAKKWLREFNHWKDESKGMKSLSSVMDIANFTSLDRPGPLDAYVTDPETGERHNMLQEYARRARGLDPIGEVPALTALLPETYGVLVTQEGLEKVYRELTGCSGAEATSFRSDISKKKMEKVNKAFNPFMERATPKVGEAQARAIWEQVVTFGQYGFNLSHAVAYSIEAYACAWLKTRYPLEWWTAVLRVCLREGKKKKIIEEHWKYCRQLIDPPSIRRGGESFEIRDTRIIAPLDFLQGVGPKASEELIAGMPFVSMEDFCKKVMEQKRKTAKPSPKTGKLGGGRSALGRGVVYKLIVAGSMDDLFEPGTSLATKLYEYENQTNLASGKRAAKIDKTMQRWYTMDPIAQYQMKKKIFPVSFDSLLEIIVREQLQSPIAEIVPSGNGNYRLMPKGELAEELHERGIGSGNAGFFIADGIGVKRFNDIPWSNDFGKLLAGVVMYVVSSNSFTYQREGKTMTAHKMFLDVAGETVEFMAWPDKSGKPRFARPETGSIIIGILGRYGPRPANLEYVHTLRPPLEMKEDAESDDTGTDPQPNQGEPEVPGHGTEAVRSEDEDGDSQPGDSAPPSE